MPAKRKVTLELIYAKLLSHDRQFEKIDTRFKKVDQRFDKIDQRFDKVDQRFDKVDQRFEKTDKHLAKHDRQFEGLIRHILHVEESLKAEIASEIAKVMERVYRLEALVEKMTGDLERLQQEYFALTQAVKRIEKTLEARSIRDEQFNTVLTRLDRIERHLGLVLSDK